MHICGSCIGAGLPASSCQFEKKVSKAAQISFARKASRITFTLQKTTVREHGALRHTPVNDQKQYFDLDLHLNLVAVEIQKIKPC